MRRMLLALAAVLLATGAGLTGRVIAGGPGIGPSPASALRSQAVPAYLKLVPMDAPAAAPAPAITIDIPINGTIYPPDLIPPQFAWRDANPAVSVWRIEIAFGEHTRQIKAWSNGEKM